MATAAGFPFGANIMNSRTMPEAKNSGSMQFLFNAHAKAYIGKIADVGEFVIGCPSLNNGQTNSK